MKRILLLVAAAAAALAQTPSRYFDGYTGSLAASASITLTWQQAASPTTRVYFEGASTGLAAGLMVQCPGNEFTIAQAANGTAATQTAATIVKLPGTYSAPLHTFWTSSNVGAGTAIAPLLTYSAGAIAALDWSSMSLGSRGTAANLSLTVTNIGGSACTVAVSNYVREQ